jgi:hypothetical protein
VSDNDKVDYSIYVASHANRAQVFSVFSGFTFTAITLLLTLLPDPSQITSQVILLFLVVLLDILGVLLYGEQIVLFYCVRTAPRLPEGFKAGIFNSLGVWVWVLLAGMVLVMFLAWNLVYLALAAAIVSAFFSVSGFILTKPLREALRKRWVRK